MTVLDITHVMAGPFCTYILRLLGADVIKVERLGEGDVLRHYDPRPEFEAMAPPFQAINAGKQSIAIDLKRPEGIALARRLAAKADIVVENFRPGVLDRLGLGYADCRALNPDVIYCSLTGFGQTGPMRDNPAYDHIVQAICGVMSLTGDPQGEPSKVGFPLVDSFTGYAGALAVVSAALKRARFGGGEYIDLAMLDSTLLLMISMVGPYLIAGDVPRRVGNRGFNPSPTAATFAAADGPLLLGANTQKQYESMCQVLDAPGLVQDARFASPETRIENASALLEALHPLFARRSAAVWEKAFNAVGVPAAAIRTIPEIADDPHIAHRGALSGFTRPDGQPGRTVNLGFALGRPEDGELTPPPRIGEHSAAILARLGLSDQEIAQLQQERII